MRIKAKYDTFRFQVSRSHQPKKAEKKQQQLWYPSFHRLETSNIITMASSPPRSRDSLPVSPLNLLPPPPKLRPRPGLKKLTPTVVVDNAATFNQQQQHQQQIMYEQQHREQHQQQQQQLLYEDHETLVEQTDESTSRLLMKSECKGSGGRKRSSGSLVHSIPKFSQVKPNGRLTEVQRVLQSRIILKQQQKQREQQEQLQQEMDRQHHHQIQLQKSSKNSQVQPQAPLLPMGKATNLLQNIISLHERRISPPKSFVSASSSSEPFSVPSLTTTIVPSTSSSLVCGAFSSSSSSSSTSSSPSSSTSHFKRRGRKLAKEAICHVVITPSSTDSARVNPEEKNDEESAVEIFPSSLNQPPILPRLSEVTITPTSVPSSQPPRKRSPIDSALDLRLVEKSPSPEIVEVDVDPIQPDDDDDEDDIAAPDNDEEEEEEEVEPVTFPPWLSVADFERTGMPQGYIFCPNANVFVHPSVLSPSLFSRFQLPLPTSNVPFSALQTQGSVTQSTSTDSATSSIPTMESLQSVIRVRPQKPEIHRINSLMGAKPNTSLSIESISSPTHPTTVMTPKSAAASAATRKRKASSTNLIPSDGNNEVRSNILTPSKERSKISLFSFVGQYL